jgi:hypothetical protein
MADGKNENKIKHLEFIQLTITRMNVNSFMVKGWLVTLVAAIFVLSNKDANPMFLWFTPFISILFWILDAFFVSTERKYRSLYDEVRIKQEVDIDYSMDVSKYESGRNSFFMSLLSITMMLFYPVVIAASIIASAYFNK